jgi:hypothetical protein
MMTECTFPAIIIKTMNPMPLRKNLPNYLFSGIHKCAVSVPKKKYNGCHNPIFSLINMHVVITQTKIIKHYLGAIREWLEVALEARS